MNTWIFYITIWLLSFFFPAVVYFILEKIRHMVNLNKKTNISNIDNKNKTMPFFNKFSIILLAIFSSANSILFHLISMHTDLL